VQSLHLKVGMTVKIDDATITLTQALLNLLLPRDTTPVKTKPVVKSGREHAKGPKLCTKCKVTLPAALLAVKPFAKLCVTCKEAKGDVPTYKGQQVTEGKSLYDIQILPLGVEPQNGSLLRSN